MRREFMVGKLHGIRVTGSELHYEGSIEIDPELCEMVGMLPLQFVEVWNKASGARISTYIVHGPRGSRCCVLNGAAARTCQKGDELIVAARAEIETSELEDLSSRVLILNGMNEVIRAIEYGLQQVTTGSWSAVPKVASGCVGAASRAMEPC
ncbi:MAG: aspartate 1-decarboxylase [Pseudomonadota bacterium]|nr:aspartate 1-decarboxylase [Pseudomonadota bacterium]